MTVRMRLLAHFPTAATSRAQFPQDEQIEPVDAAPLVIRPGARVVRGPEVRCVQTCTTLGLDAVGDEALRDWDLGRWAGRRLDELSVSEPDSVATWLTDSGAAPHDGEPLDELLTRVSAWLAGPDAATTVAVTHPAIVRAGVVAALGLDASAFWRIDVAPGTAAALSGRDGRWNINQLGAPIR